MRNKPTMIKYNVDTLLNKIAKVVDSTENQKTRRIVFESLEEFGYVSMCRSEFIILDTGMSDDENPYHNLPLYLETALNHPYSSNLIYEILEANGKALISYKRLRDAKEETRKLFPDGYIY